MNMKCMHRPLTRGIPKKKPPLLTGAKHTGKLDRLFLTLIYAVFLVISIGAALVVVLEVAFFRRHRENLQRGAAFNLLA
jgi:hypothetical protein